MIVQLSAHGLIHVWGADNTHQPYVEHADFYRTVYEIAQGSIGNGGPLRGLAFHTFTDTACDVCIGSYCKAS